MHAPGSHVHLGKVNSKQLELLRNTTADDRAMLSSAMLYVGWALSADWRQCMHT